MRKKRPGRPAIPKNERKIESIRVAVTEAEKRQIEKVAKASGMSISDYVRFMILGAVSE